MRGKPYQGFAKQNYTRITPADAGKTARLKCLFCNVQDHPRGCGENGADLSHSATALGSPPRMRGKPAAQYLDTRTLRITPADAGKTRHIY